MPSPAPGPARRSRATVTPLSPRLHQPTAQRPLRMRRLKLATDSEVLPHSHPWAQLTFSAAGAVRLTAAHGTYLVPPSRALWIPPGVEHAVTVIEDAELLTLYLHQPRGRCGPGVPAALQAPWRECRVLEVSDLMRALVAQMDGAPDDPRQAPAADLLQREALLAALILDEVRRAPPVRLGVALPQDKRLRALCEAVLDEPARHRTLDDWARDSGASPRTIARLFREQLGVSFGQWRQQVFLTRALALAARGTPMARIAGELGYASASAFTAMVRRTVGQPPRRFFAAAV
ncbi:AraC family transcriptional regulator [Aquabacterium sp.]|uniref:AraC family transcriptional regulator n=1 Tax=Aquabacterium sp. TaxID=1872578 RepID=UPI002CD73CEC|nr:helix-turn-helix transcriptional regulator [Aquabacterium sp.]HSW08888.1 helix-turn-helix transcriptional regulator [Aquabacterium sp.]